VNRDELPMREILRDLLAMIDEDNIERALDAGGVTEDGLPDPVHPAYEAARRAYEALSAEGDGPFSTYPEDRAKLLDLARKCELSDDANAIELGDLVRAILEDEAVAIASEARDTARLDFLDECNRRLNAQYGTNYGWRLILNHNVNRLMLGHLDVDLDDSTGGNNKLPSCRAAIDTEMDRVQAAKP